MSSPASDALQSALALVIDPEIRRNVVELGMVDAVDVDGGHVHVTIRLTMPGLPAQVEPRGAGADARRRRARRRGA